MGGGNLGLVILLYFMYACNKHYIYTHTCTNGIQHGHVCGNSSAHAQAYIRTEYIHRKTNYIIEHELQLHTIKLALTWTCVCKQTNIQTKYTHT